jgi:hypothetical protein
MKEIKEIIRDYTYETKQLSLKKITEITEPGTRSKEFPYLDKSYLSASQEAEEFNELSNLANDNSHTLQIINVIDYKRMLEGERWENSKEIKTIDWLPNQDLNSIEKCIIKHSSYSGDSYKRVGFVKNYDQKEPLSGHLDLTYLKTKIVYFYSPGSDYLMLLTPTDGSYYYKFRKSLKYKFINSIVSFLRYPAILSGTKVIYSFLLLYIILTASLILFAGSNYIYAAIILWASFVTSVVTFLNWKQKLTRSYSLTRLKLTHLENISKQKLLNFYNKLKK